MIKRKYFKQRFKEQEVASERVKILFDLAKKEFPKHPERSQHYASMILDTAKRMKLRLPLSVKRFICRKCSSLLVPSKTLKVRSLKGFMIYQCLNCNYIRRYGYLKNKKA